MTRSFAALSLLYWQSLFQFFFLSSFYLCAKNNNPIKWCCFGGTLWAKMFYKFLTENPVYYVHILNSHYGPIMDKHAQGYRQKMMSKRVMNCYNILLVFTKLMLQFDMINDVNNIVRFNHLSVLRFNMN